MALWEPWRFKSWKHISAVLSAAMHVGLMVESASFLAKIQPAKFCLFTFGTEVLQIFVNALRGFDWFRFSRDLSETPSGYDALKNVLSGIKP